MSSDALRIAAPIVEAVAAGDVDLARRDVDLAREAVALALTASDLARELRCSVKTIRRLDQSGRRGPARSR